MKVTLYDIAHARTGDKGTLNTVSLIPYDEQWYPVLRQVVTDRLENEFRSPVHLEPLGYSIARRTDAEGAAALAGPSEVEVLRRRADGVLLAVFSTKWRLETVRRKLPDITLDPLPAGTADH